MELKIITEAEKDIMLDLLTDDSIKQTYMLPDFESRETSIPLFQRLCALSKDKTHFVRGIFTDGKLVGFLNDVEIENGTIELGYVIHPDHWGKGYATAALKVAITQLFDLGYHMVLAGAFAENPASLRVMEKAGMRKISKTDTIEYRGVLHSCVYCQIDRS